MAFGFGRLPENPALKRFIYECAELCEPAKVFVSDGSAEAIRFVREEALRNCEEQTLAAKGHTLHFDSPEDQGRALGDTKVLMPKGKRLPFILTKERKAGLAEMRRLLKGIMKGRTMYVQFHTLGPAGSRFSIPCVQITDSAYVAHSENLLYRQGYDEFRRLGRKAKFLRFVHSAGELENGISKNIRERRIYIDLAGEAVYGVNTQYAGNSVGLKKLALRLTIKRASQQGWLSEHMFIMGVRGPKKRVSYFTGAFPSACGKTSTAMLAGERIVGDDLAYLWVADGRVHAVNPECGMFGIITGVNRKDDPEIWRVLHSPAEVVFSNVLLLPGGRVFWTGSGEAIPAKGVNYAGKWQKGGRAPPSHPNARFAVGLKAFRNLDGNLDEPGGVPVSGIIYGGRDSDTSVPVEQSFSWEHGVVMKAASLESETTSATIGAVGVRQFNPMANLNFLSIPVGRYVKDNLEFGKTAKMAPPIFSVNYFLKGRDGKFLNGKRDKAVWLKWMELRAHGEVGAVETPTGLIPEYGDLRELFRKVLGKEYAREVYGEQFRVRIPENLAKIARMEKIYRRIPDAPREIFRVLKEQRERLLEARKKCGDCFSPA